MPTPYRVGWKETNQHDIKPFDELAEEVKRLHAKENKAKEEEIEQWKYMELTGKAF